jgi:hypothetical protein
VLWFQENAKYKNIFFTKSFNSDIRRFCLHAVQSVLRTVYTLRYVTRQTKITRRARPTVHFNGLFPPSRRRNVARATITVHCSPLRRWENRFSWLADHRCTDIGDRDQWRGVVCKCILFTIQIFYHPYN